MTVVDLTDIRVRREGAVWVSHCPALDFFTQGRTRSEAIAACRSGVRVLVDLARKGMPVPALGVCLPAKGEA